MFVTIPFFAFYLKKFAILLRMFIFSSVRHYRGLIVLANHNGCLCGCASIVAVRFRVCVRMLFVSASLS